MSGIAAVILAAGQASRFRAAGGQGPTKLLATWEGLPLVCHVVAAALGSRVERVILVTGHAADAVTHAIGENPLHIVHNAAYAEGLSGSLAVGLDAVPAPCRGAIVLLSDMPEVTSAVIDMLIEHSAANSAADAVVPVSGGRRGNPVLLHRRLFPAAKALSGDTGARALLRDPLRAVLDVPIADTGILRDIDLPEHLDKPEG